MYNTLYYIKSVIKENFNYYYNRLKSKYNVFYFTYIHNTNYANNNLLQL